MKTGLPGSINLEAVSLRAAALARLREFFTARNVMEVETPSLSEAATPDPNLTSLGVTDEEHSLFLHTSPEFGMKRLLVAGAGDIYQICRVYRGGEAGRIHRREFTLLEWYRLGYSMEALMAEVLELCEYVGRCRLGQLRSQTFTAAFERYLGLDWRSVDTGALRGRISECGTDPGTVTDKQGLLELALATVVAPRLGEDGAEFLTHFPASMAALAALNPQMPDTADRFELFVHGVEIANGFRELTDAREQRTRFEEELNDRAERGLEPMPLDERFLSALERGLPPCSGVALGFDRLLMVAGESDRLDTVLGFPQE